MTADPHPSESRIQSAVEAEIRPIQTVSTTTVRGQSPINSAVRHRTGIDLWLHRITVLMFVFVCAVVGVLLVILPWRPEWTDNRLLFSNPGLRAFIANGFVRGLCSGLGLLDIWIGFWEAVHYHETTTAR